MRMYELAMVVDLAGEIGVILLCRLENYLLRVSSTPHIQTYIHTLEPLVSLCVAK